MNNYRATFPLASLSDLQYLLITVACLLLLIGLVAPKTAKAETQQGIAEYNISAGPLAEALNRFAEQSGLLIGGDGALTQGKQSPGLQGRFTVEQALHRLLKDTGITYRLTGGNRAMLALARENSGPLQLNAITITGEREDRTILETRASVSVLDAQAIEQRAQQDVYESLIGTPNVVVTEGDALPSIRGLQATARGSSLGSAVLNGVQPRTVLIVDDFARNPIWTNISYTSLFDAEQIEVMRGAQSTLRGRNAMAGAVVVTTAEPTFDFSAKVATDVFDDNALDTGYNVGATVSGPLVEDTLAARLTVEQRRDSDVIDGFVPGSFSGSGDPDDAQTRKNRRFSGKLLFLPANAPEWESSLQISHSEGRTPIFTNFISGLDRGVSFEDRLLVASDYRVLDNESNFVGGKIAFESANAGTFEILASYGKDEAETDLDLNSSGVVFNSLDETGTSLEALWRFGASGSGLSGLTGVAYTSNRAEMDATAFGTVAVTADNQTKSYSVFGDLSYALTDRIDVHFGGRVLQTKQKRSFTFAVPLVSDERMDETVFLPKVGLTYALNGNQTLGVSTRRGFNDGGRTVNTVLLTSQAFDPEYVWTYEGTYRGVLLDGRAVVSATAFYNDFRDQQLTVQVTAGPDSFEVVNQPRSRSYGLELEGSMQLTDSIKINAGLGLLDTETTESAGLNVQDGNEFGQDPDITLSGGIDWSPTEYLAFDGRVSYVGKYFNAAQNIEGQEGGDYTIIDVGATYSYGPMSVRLYVQNLTDELAYITRFNDFSATVLAPRIIGATIKVDL